MAIGRPRSTWRSARGTDSIFLGGLCGSAVLGAAALAAIADPPLQPSATAPDRAEGVPARHVTPAGSEGGPAAAGPVGVCSWDNGAPGDCLLGPASQYSPIYPFFAEAANDFILVDGGANPCRLTEVTVWLDFFNGQDAPSSITGYLVTVYLDAGDPKGPGGQPNDDGTHTDALETQFVPASAVTLMPITQPVSGTIYEARIPLLLDVPKNQKLWIAVAPQIEFPPQVALVVTQAGPFDHPAQQHFDLLGIPWTEIAGGDCDGDGTPDDLDGDGIGDYREIAMSIVGEKGPFVAPACPGDCAPQGDLVVDILDLLSLLSQWGGEGPCDADGDGFVGILDLLALLSNWGPCPVVPEDECNSSIDVPVFGLGGLVPIDMRLATPSPEPYLCVPSPPGSHADAWYCLQFNVGEPVLVSITSTFDVFLEVYDTCACPPGLLAACAPGLPQFGGIQNLPVIQNQRLALRVINYNDLPPDELLGHLSIGVDTFGPCGNCICFDATPIEIGQSVFGNTIDRPDGLGVDCGDAIDLVGTGTQWYEVIGDGTTLTASTCHPGTFPNNFNFDTQLSVFCTAECPGPCIDGNDNDGSPECGLTSTVTWCSRVGRTYSIVVHGTNPPLDEGIFELRVESDGIPCNPAQDCGPPNDLCVDRITLAGADLCVPYDTTFATTDGPDNPNGLCSDNGGVATAHDIWFNYQVPASGFLTVDTCEDIACGTADYDTDLVVYGPYASQPTAADCDPAALLANIAGCNDDALEWPCGSAAPWHSVVEFPVTAGEWYKIRVGGWQEGDLGTGTLHVDIGPIPTGACCVDGVCLGALEELDCLAQAGCLFHWERDTTCATFDCTPTPLPCDPTAVGGNGAADGINGVTPSAAIGGWNFGEMGVAEDLLVCAPTTAVSFHTEFIDLTTPVGTPSAIDRMLVRIYDASAGVFEVDPTVDVPLCEFDLSVTAGNVNKSICGGPFFGGDVECWDGEINCPLAAGVYLVYVSFPELSDSDYFIATGVPHPSSTEHSQIFGINPFGPPVFGGPTGQHNSFCVGD